MAWGNSWEAIGKMSKAELITETGKTILKELLDNVAPVMPLTSLDLATGQRTTLIGYDLGNEDKTVVSVMRVIDGVPNLVHQSDNLVFVCDTCDAIFDPGITGFQKLIDAARKAGWLITFHVLKEGYAMCCPSCKA